MKVSNIFIFAACLVVFNQYSFPIGGVSITLDRILLLLGMPLLLFTINWSKLNKTILFYISALIISTFLTIITGKSYAVSSLAYYLPVYIYCLILFFLGAVYITQYIGDAEIITILKFHVLVIAFFSLYTYYFVLFKGTLEFNYPLSNFLPDFANDAHKFSMIRSNRLWFPESSAPRLGFITGFLSLFFLLHYINERSNKSYLVYFSLSTLVMFGTLSRSSMISFFLAILTYVFYILVNRKSQSLKIKPVLRIAIFSFFALVLFLSFGFFDASRLLELNLEDGSSVGHLGIRVEVFNRMIGSDLLTLIFGNGIGSMSSVLNISSAHSSYFTVLFERGILGLAVFLGLYLTIFRKTWKSRYVTNYFDGDLILLISFLFYSHWLYEASMVPTYWLYTGIVFGLVSRKFNITQ